MHLNRPSIHQKRRGNGKKSSSSCAATGSPSRQALRTLPSSSSSTSLNFGSSHISIVTFHISFETLLQKLSLFQVFLFTIPTTVIIFRYLFSLRVCICLWTFFEVPIVSTPVGSVFTFQICNCCMTKCKERNKLDFNFLKYYWE